MALAPENEIGLPPTSSAGAPIAERPKTKKDKDNQMRIQQMIQQGLLDEQWLRQLFEGDQNAFDRAQQLTLQEVAQEHDLKMQDVVNAGALNLQNAVNAGALDLQALTASGQIDLQQVISNGQIDLQHAVNSGQLDLTSLQNQGAIDLAKIQGATERDVALIGLLRTGMDQSFALQQLREGQVTSEQLAPALNNIASLQQKGLLTDQQRSEIAGREISAADARADQASQDMAARAARAGFGPGDPAIAQAQARLKADAAAGAAASGAARETELAAAEAQHQANLAGLDLQGRSIVTRSEGGLQDLTGDQNSEILDFITSGGSQTAQSGSGPGAARIPQSPGGFQEGQPPTQTQPEQGGGTTRGQGTQVTGSDGNTISPFNPTAGGSPPPPPTAVNQMGIQELMDPAKKDLSLRQQNVANVDRSADLQQLASNGQLDLQQLMSNGQLDLQQASSAGATSPDLAQMQNAFSAQEPSLDDRILSFMQDQSVRANAHPSIREVMPAPSIGTPAGDFAAQVNQKNNMRRKQRDAMKRRRGGGSAIRPGTGPVRPGDPSTSPQLGVQPRTGAGVGSGPAVDAVRKPAEVTPTTRGGAR